MELPLTMSLGLRKREKLQGKSVQAEPEVSAPDNSNETETRSSTGDVSRFSEDPPARPSTVIAQYENQFAQHFDVAILEAIAQDAQPFFNTSIHGAAGESFTNDTSVDDLFSPSLQQGTMQHPFVPADNDTNFPDFSIAQIISQSFPLDGGLELNCSEGILPSSLALTQPVSTSASLQYAMTDPNLRALSAKITIFSTIVGPGFSFDLWDPTALSPICLGAPARPCPVNFQPTYLQRSIPHHSVIDVFPWPAFRNRFLYTMSLPKELRPKIAQENMATLTVEFIMAAKDGDGGLRIWGSSAFEPESWEIGQTFYSKFWWAMDASVVRSSNLHRARRGERPLRYECLEAT